MVGQGKFRQGHTSKGQPQYFCGRLILQLERNYGYDTGTQDLSKKDETHVSYKEVLRSLHIEIHRGITMTEEQDQRAGPR
jgi:hypothetical protein